MQKRTFKSYRNLFRGLKEACRRAGFDLSPVAHLMDFEYAAARASKEVFPQTKQIFCHFHFAKSIWRNLQKKVRIYVQERNHSIRDTIFR